MNIVFIFLDIFFACLSGYIAVESDRRYMRVLGLITCVMNAVPLCIKIMLLL